MAKEKRIPQKGTITVALGESMVAQIDEFIETHEFKPSRNEVIKRAVERLLDEARLAGRFYKKEEASKGKVAK